MLLTNKVPGINKGANLKMNKGISRFNPVDNLTEDQLNLLIHNCNVYGVSAVIKKKYVDQLEKLESAEQIINKQNK